MSLKRAAEVLREEAKRLKDEHSRAGIWYVHFTEDMKARKRYDEMLALAEELEKIADLHKRWESGELSEHDFAYAVDSLLSRSEVGR